MNDIAKALGYYWHEKKMSSSQDYRRRQLSIDKRFKKALNSAIEKFNEIEPKSGKTYGKIAHDLDAPSWVWFVNIAPKNVVDDLKKTCGIEDDIHPVENEPIQ